MVRLAVLEDLPLLLELSKDFYFESGYKGSLEFDSDSMSATLTNLIEQDCILTDGETGLIAYVVFPMFFNHSEMVAQELMWYVKKDARKSGVGVTLLKRAEQECKSKGAKIMIMLYLDSLGENVANLYKSLGYEKRETSLMRVL